MRSRLYVALIVAIAVTAAAADANAWPKWGVRKKLNTLGQKATNLRTRTVDRFKALSPRKEAALVTSCITLFGAALLATAAAYCSQLDWSSVQWVWPWDIVAVGKEQAARLQAAGVPPGDAFVGGIKTAFRAWDWRTQISTAGGATGLVTVLTAPFGYKRYRQAAESAQQKAQGSLPQLAE